MKTLCIILVLLLDILSVPHHGLSSELAFECGFLQERFPRGKSNEASCSMDPDKVFSTSQHEHDKNDHCRIEAVSHYEDYINFFVTDELVSWKEQFGVTETFKLKMKKYYIEQGKTEKEAEESINVTRSTNYSFRVSNHYMGQDNIYIDSLTQQPYKPPKKQNIHIYTFGNDIQSFSLYIPEINKKAILIEYSSTEDSSWVRIRFGTCRIKSNNP